MAVLAVRHSVCVLLEGISQGPVSLPECVVVCAGSSLPPRVCYYVTSLQCCVQAVLRAFPL